MISTLMTTPVAAPAVRCAASGWWPPMRPILLVLLWVVLSASCTRVIPGEVGDRCDRDNPCKPGLRCSFAKKRCYRPVDCGRLQKRLEACAPELLQTRFPGFKKLPAARRVRLVSQVTERLRSEVVKPCRYDARAAKRKHGKTPTVKRSWGEDPHADKMNACLAKPACEPFARCVLELAHVIGPKAPRGDRMRLLPLDHKRPRAKPPGPGQPSGRRPPPDKRRAMPTVKR